MLKAKLILIVVLVVLCAIIVAGIVEQLRITHRDIYCFEHNECLLKAHALMDRALALAVLFTMLMLALLLMFCIWTCTEVIRYYRNR